MLKSAINSRRGGLRTKLKKLVRRIFGFEKIERGELSRDEYKKKGEARSEARS